MTRLALLALALCAMQDPAETVRALVEKLGSEEIAEREKAAADLIKLGPAALPALRKHEAGSEGVTRTALRSVINRIERTDRLDKLLGSGPAVTLDVKDAEIEKVIAEMARQTGLDITGFFLDSSMRVTLKCQATPVWKAVDDLCRAHGGSAARYTSRTIVVEGGLEPGTALATNRSLAVQFRPPRRSQDGKLMLNGVVTYPPGVPVWTTALEFDEITDDQKTSLATRDDDGGFSLADYLPLPGVAGQFASKVNHRSSGELGKGAKRLSRLRGSVVAKVPVEFKTLITVPHPMKESSTLADEGGYRVELTPKRKDEKVMIRIRFHQRPEGDKDDDHDFERDTKRAFGIRDDQGVLYVTRARSMIFEDSEPTQVEVLVPKGREIAAFEIMDILEFTEIRIPFDFSELPISVKGE